MKKIYWLFIVIITSIAKPCSAQQQDSLWKVYLNTNKPDTDRLKAIDEISWSFRNNNPDTAIILAQQQIELAIKAKARKIEANAHLTIGTAYKSKGNYPKTLENYLQALSIRESLKDTVGAAVCFVNIGNVYVSQSDFQKALDYQLKALHLFEQIKDKKGIGYCYGNIGTAYGHQLKYKQALDCFFKSLAIQKETGDKRGEGICYGNIGNVYSTLSDYPKALENYLKALQLRREIGDKRGIGTCYVNLGSLCYKTTDYKSAVNYSDSALFLTKQTGDLENERMAYQTLADAYNKTGRYKEAYDNEVLFKKLTDSIFNADNSRQMGDMKTRFEVEKKEAELKVKADAQQAINKEERKRQQLTIYAVLGVLLIVFVFSMFLFRRFKITQKQKHIIGLQKDEVLRQKHIVEEHQKEIIDSITYAKRLQQAILPSDDEIKKHLPETFIYYKPKDIVAGDFYWMEHLDGITFIAAADSTGHGVPGAMVSVVCSNALNRAIKEFGLRDTGKILDKTRELVLETFEKSGEKIKDGMDISLIAIHPSYINWSGANNALLYIADNKLTEIKADKQPIGQTDDPKPFTTHTLNLQKGDIVYLMTDGYSDQFGGAKGKKFKYKQLEENLLANSNLPLEEQKTKLAKAFEAWKGNLEQVDDVTLIGIKL